MDTIQTDVATQNTGFTEDEAADAFLKKFMGEETPPEDNKKESTPEEQETPDSSPEGEDDELLIEDDEDKDPSDDDNKDEPQTRVASDDDEVVVQVDGKDVKASVKDLKRLYGQEAALTRKNQELAEQRKVAQAQGLRATAALQKLHDKAVAKLKEFEKIDMFVASRELTPEQFDDLRAAQAQAAADVKFIEEEAEAYFKELQETQAKALQETAKTSVAKLKEDFPKLFKKEWSEEVYDGIRSYAVSQGFTPEVVNQLVDPVALTLIHKASLYDAAVARAKATKAAAKKVVKKPEKVLKSEGRAPQANTKRQEAIKKMRQRGGDLDSAAEAFLALSQDD